MKTRIGRLSVTVGLGLAAVFGVIGLLSSAPAHAAPSTDSYSVYYVAPGGDCGGMTPCFSTVQAAVDAVDADPWNQITNLDRLERAFSALVPLSPQAGVIYVNDDAPGPTHDGLSWTTAFTDLQDALITATSGAEIWVAEGVYYPGATVSDTFGLKSGVAIYGCFGGIETQRAQRNCAAHPTILSGDIDHNDANLDGNDIAETWNDIRGSNAYHVLHAVHVDETAVLDGFIVTAGSATGPSPYGNIGGGMFSLAGSCTLSNITFIGNQSSLHGGGIASYSAAPTLINVIFRGNYSPQGGGLYNEDSPAMLINVLFDHNHAGEGGGIYNEGSDATLINVTLANNQASRGGGIVNTYTTTLVLQNVIIWGNLAPEYPQIYNEKGGAASVTYSDVQGGYPGAGNLDADPLFIDPANGNYRLQPGSPCIDVGDNSVITFSTDLDGNPRIVGDVVDMGAYEFGGAPWAHFIGVVSFDNDLSPYVDEVIERFRIGTVTNSAVRATLLVDQLGHDNTEVVEIARGVVTHTGELPWLPGVHELDTADPNALAGFIIWARAQHPAERAIVALLGHGAGLTPEIHAGQSPMRAGILSRLPALPRGRDRTSIDVTSGTYLSTPELGRALLAATNDGANPFDVLFLDGCFYGNLDTLYEIRQTSNVIVASPNYAWAAFAYDRYLPHFTPTAAPQAMAQAIVDEYEAALDDGHPNAIFWVRGADLVPIANALSALGDALQSTLNVQLILEAALHSQFADTTLCAGELECKPPDEMMGLGSFCRNLQARFPSGSEVHTAAGNVLAALANVHGAHRTGQPWIKPEVTWNYTDTLTIIAPLTPTLALTPDKIWRASLYTSTVPLAAVWSPQPTRTVTITTPWAFTKDGRWDDFIAVWYAQSAPMTPTVGELCHAFPLITSTVNITEVIPGYGYNNAPTQVYIRGSGFVSPAVVFVGSEPLQDVIVVNENLLRAIIPAGLAPGRYNVSVSTPRGQAVARNAFEALNAAAVDDLLSWAEWLWTDPLPLRVGNPNNRLGLNVQRLGDQFTIGEGVTVEFRLGSPQGWVIGRGWTTPFPPNAITSTSPVAWSPQAAGQYTICAVIDPDNLVPETDESNNIVCRAIVVLPAGPDFTPPVVDRFIIQDNVPDTLDITVTLDVTATDPAPNPSGIYAIKFIEFEYIYGARRWVPVIQSGWIDYAIAHRDYPWSLLPIYGMRYMQAWAADKAGNVSLQPGADVINLLPTLQQGYVAQGGVVIYRYYLAEGQSFEARLTPVEGDPDLYVWGPNSQLWYSNNGQGLEDVVTFDAPGAGTYQIEVHGYTAAHYRLAMQAGAAQRAQYALHGTDNDKPLPLAPAIPLNDWPAYYSPDTGDLWLPQKHVYLPLVLR